MSSKCLIPPLLRCVVPPCDVSVTSQYDVSPHGCLLQPGHSCGKFLRCTWSLSPERFLSSGRMMALPCLPGLFSLLVLCQYHETPVSGASACDLEKERGASACDLEKERDTLQKEKGDLIKERGDLIEERGDLIKERDTLQKEKGDLIKERDSLQKDKGDLLIKAAKVMVTLDPDTAHRRLLMSEGGRRVKETDTWITLPDTPKTFTYYPCALGSEGFTSGRHYWEVQPLQEGDAWEVGVAAESVNRKGAITWSPEGGVWPVGWWKGQYTAFTSPRTPLSPREKPLKLGVYLDYEGGRLSLYNADSMEFLFSFPQAPFTQRLFPLFCLWGGAELRLV